MTYLVSGGAGFIGANFNSPVGRPGRAHERAGQPKRAGRRSDLTGLPVEFIQGDIRDLCILDRAVAGFRAVIHLAAHTNVVESIKQCPGDLQSAPGQCQTRSGAVYLSFHRPLIPAEVAADSDQNRPPLFLLPAPPGGPPAT